MEYNELTSDERVLLVGMIRKVAGADQKFSDQEKAELNKVAEQMGGGLFKEADQQAVQLFTSVEAIEASARSVTRPESRELIFTTLQDLAVSDEVASEEMELVNWLADLWDL